jgi:hypothetical protein
MPDLSWVNEENRLDALEKTVKEIARGVNTQAALLTTIVLAFDMVTKKYLELATKNREVANEGNIEGPQSKD